MTATFTPPVLDRTPAVLPSTRGVQFALYRHVKPMAQGLNVWKMPDGTYLLDQQPAHLSNPDPANHANDASTPVITYYGGHIYQVDDVEAAALAAAGFASCLSAPLVDPNSRNPITFGDPPPFYGGTTPPGAGGALVTGYSDIYSDLYSDNPGAIGVGYSASYGTGYN